MGDERLLADEMRQLRLSIDRLWDVLTIQNRLLTDIAHNQIGVVRLEQDRLIEIKSILEEMNKRQKEMVVKS